MNRKALIGQDLIHPLPLRERVGRGVIHSATAREPGHRWCPIPLSPTLPREGGGSQKCLRCRDLWLIQRYCADEFLRAHRVHHSSGGHLDVIRLGTAGPTPSRTGLDKPNAAVCFWFITFNAADVIDAIGHVPPEPMRKIGHTIPRHFYATERAKGDQAHCGRPHCHTKRSRPCFQFLQPKLGTLLELDTRVPSCEHTTSNGLPRLVVLRRTSFPGRRPLVRIIRIALLLVLFFPPLAGAAPILNGGAWDIDDGGTYYATQFFRSSVQIQNGTLNIRTGADLVYVSTVSTSGQQPYLENTATINMTGGQVETGITVQQGTLNVSGGQVTGGSAGSVGNAIDSMGSAVITGGTFIGGLVPSSTGSPLNAGSRRQCGRDLLPGRRSHGHRLLVHDEDQRRDVHWRDGCRGGVRRDHGLFAGLDRQHDRYGGQLPEPDRDRRYLRGPDRFPGQESHVSERHPLGLLENGNPIDVQVYTDFANGTVNSSGTEVTFLPGTVTTPPPTPIPEPSSVCIFGLLAVLATCA